jgi:hypothetical protein
LSFSPPSLPAGRVPSVPLNQPPLLTCPSLRGRTQRIKRASTYGLVLSAPLSELRNPAGEKGQKPQRRANGSGPEGPKFHLGFRGI